MQDKYYIIGNWKMKLGLSESVELSRKILSGCKEAEPKLSKTVLCPSFTSLSEVQKIVGDTEIDLGAQDIFWEEKGAYTGEISASQLKELGCEYVIIGHSERRLNLNENDEMVHQKAKLLLNEGLTPIICVGETYEQRGDSQRDYVISRQVVKALEGLELHPNDKVIIAYEPVWVIGRGQAVSVTEMKETENVIRQSIVDVFPGLQNSGIFSIIYGGSVDETNVLDFIGEKKMDGVLVGTASLDSNKFLNIIKRVEDSM